MKSKTLELAIELITEPSITPHDARCQEIIAARLKPLGFAIESMNYGEVKNLYARKGTAQPCLLFAGHTDVVPPGPEDRWTSPPFLPTIRDGNLYGRGAADMKSSLAAMVCACEDFIKANPQHQGSIGFLITSDEEGPSIHGTKHVVQELLQRNEKIDWCIVGEASSQDKLGDIVKVGRRGSLGGTLIIHGKQGHIAYPHKAINPIHQGLAALDQLSKTIWDTGNDFFPPTSFQISNIHAGTGANNVIPHHLEVAFNFRFSTATNAQELKHKVHTLLDSHQLNYSIEWHESGEPFLSKLGSLFTATSHAVKKIVGISPTPATDGGTSDGRFIFKTGCEILELGPNNDSIHKIDEHINIQELDLLTLLYKEIMTSLLGR